MATVIDRLLLNIDVRIQNEKNMDRVTQRLQFIQKGLLGAGLSFLFTGMAIKRFFQTALNSIFQTFLMVEGETGVINDSVHEIIAALTFLAFSLVDAFKDTGALQFWIDQVMSLVNFFNELSDGTKSALVTISIFGFLAGTALMILGQTMLGVLGVMALIAVVGLPVFLLLGALALGLIALFLIWNSEMDFAKKVLASIMIFLVGLMAFLIVFKVAVLSPWILLISVVVIVIGLFAILAKRLGSVKAAFQIVLLSMLWGFALLGDAIILSMIEPIKLVISLLLRLIRIANRIPGINIPTTGLRELEGALPETGSLSRRVEEMGRRVVARADAERVVEERAPTEAAGGVTNNFNIEGLISPDNLDSVIQQINERVGFNQGSPQQ